MATKQQVRKEIFEERGSKCERCDQPLYLYKNGKDTRGRSKAHFHHKIHRSEGGTDSKDNLLLTCWNCERSHHNKYNVQNRPRIINKQER